MHESKLKPIIHDKMDVLFVPLNPPEISNQKEHYFSLNNSFWNVLFKSELITENVLNPKINSLNDPYPDDLIFRQSKFNINNSVFGIHDLVPKYVETNSNKVPNPEIKNDHILNHTKTEKIKIICLMHSKVRRAFGREFPIIKKGLEGYGNIGTFNGTIFYYVPFPHGSNIPTKEIINQYSGLKVLLEEMRHSKIFR